MDIRLFFGASSSQPTDVKSSESEDENDSSKSDTESLEPSPAKKKKSVQEKCRSKYRQLQAIENTTRNGKRALIGSSLMTIFKEPFARFAGRGEFLFKEWEERGFQSLSKTGRRQLRR